MWVIVTGSLTAGFELTGPFRSLANAKRYAYANRDKIASVVDYIQLHREYVNC